jgi:hypothetical protein
VLAGQALVRSGDEDACARLLPGICSGERIIPIAVTDSEITDISDTVLVVADGALWEVTAPALRPKDSIDLTRRLSTIDFDERTARRLGDVSAADLEAVACVALSAEQVGAASRALELTLDYVRTRHQFGRPIGSFQVLQHRLADAHVRVSAARSASWTAAEALAAGSTEARHLASVAKVCCSETLQAVAAEMVQMHGGIAITWEHDAHLYLRRAYASARLFGSPSRHVERLAAAAGLA